MVTEGDRYLRDPDGNMLHFNDKAEVFDSSVRGLEEAVANIEGALQSNSMQVDFIITDANRKRMESRSDNGASVSNKAGDAWDSDLPQQHFEVGSDRRTSPAP